MASADGFTIRPLTRDRFDDFLRVMGTGGQGGCWCMWWIHPTTAEFSRDAKGGSKAANKGLILDVVEEGPPPGLVAYDGDEPVAWCRVTPRSMLPGIDRSRYWKTDLDTEGVWSISCFVVRQAWRGKGITGVLAGAAIEWARDHGARIVEAYPTDTVDRITPASAYRGIASTFRRLGFEVVRETAPHRTMMRLLLE